MASTTGSILASGEGSSPSGYLGGLPLHVRVDQVWRVEGVRPFVKLLTMHDKAPKCAEMTGGVFVERTDCPGRPDTPPSASEKVRATFAMYGDARIDVLDVRGEEALVRRKIVESNVANHRGSATGTYDLIWIDCTGDACVERGVYRLLQITQSGFEVCEYPP